MTSSDPDVIRSCRCYNVTPMWPNPELTTGEERGSYPWRRLTERGQLWDEKLWIVKFTLLTRAVSDVSSVIGKICNWGVWKEEKLRNKNSWTGTVLDFAKFLLSYVWKLWVVKIEICINYVWIKADYEDIIDHRLFEIINLQLAENKKIHFLFVCPPVTFRIQCHWTRY